MNCIDAQAAISAALDRAPVEASVIEEAKTHCKSCPECGSFVRALAAAKRAPLPEPPADLPDRIMVAIRAEALAAERAAANAAAAEAREAAQAERAGAPAIAGAGRPADAASRFGSLADIFAPRNRRVLAVWGSAAAVLLVLIGVATVNGVRQITDGAPATSEVAVRGDRAGSIAPQAAAPENDGAAAKAESGTATDSYGAVGGSAAAPTTSVLGFVSLNGTVYRLSGPADVDKTKLGQIGSLSYTMAGSVEPENRVVLGDADATRIFLEDDAGGLYAFTAVVRTFHGVVYAQRSSAISRYDAWPSLPSQIDAPSSADGSPTFAEVGPDDAGVTVYRLTTTDVSKGIGIAPGTGQGDPAGGNPNWTWWTPQR